MFPSVAFKVSVRVHIIISSRLLYYTILFYTTICIYILILYIYITYKILSVFFQESYSEGTTGVEGFLVVRWWVGGEACTILELGSHHVPAPARSATLQVVLKGTQ